jgi:hypothetical protein
MNKVPTQVDGIFWLEDILGSGSYGTLLHDIDIQDINLLSLTY